MIYDLQKIYKKILKFWYVFLVTIIMAIISYLCVKNTYQYTTSFYIDSIENINVDYYLFAQKEITSRVVLNSENIFDNANNVNYKVNLNLEDSVEDIFYIKMELTSNDSNFDNVSKEVKDKIIKYTKDNILSDYSNIKTDIKLKEMGKETIECLSKIKVIQIYVWLILIELCLFLILGLFDDKIISKNEIINKFGKVVLCANLDETIINYYINKNLRENKKILFYYESNTKCSITQKFQIDTSCDISSIINYDVLFLYVEINKTTGKGISSIIDYINNFSNKEIYFIVNGEK